MKNILVHCMVSLGDVIMATSVLPILRQAWPEARITMMVKEANRAVVEGNPAVDDFIVYQYQKKSWAPRRMWNWIADLRRRRFDMSLSLDRHQRVSFMTWLARIPVRVGPRHIFNYVDNRVHYFYTDALEPTLNIDQAPRIEVMQDLVRQYTGLPGAVGRPSFGRLEKFHHEKAARLLAELPAAEHRVGLGFQSSLPVRSWPPDRFAQLIDYLWEKENTACFIVGTADQKDLAESVIKQTRHKARNFCGQTDLKTLGALFLAADGFVSPDTGSTHLAAAVNAPLVTIFTSTTPGGYHPVSGTEAAESWNLTLWAGCECSPCEVRNLNECPNQLVCMYDLTVEDVAESLKKLFIRKS